MLSKAQRDLLAVIDVGWTLHQNDEVPGRWFLRSLKIGRLFWKVRANTAESLARHGLIQISEHEDGWPGVDRYCITPAGRAALAERV